MNNQIKRERIKVSNLCKCRITSIHPMIIVNKKIMIMFLIILAQDYIVLTEDLISAPHISLLRKVSKNVCPHRFTTG